MSSDFDHTNIELALQNLSQQFVRQQDINEMLLIQQQTDLMNELMKPQFGTAKCHTFSTQVSELSFQSFEKGRGLNSSISAISLCREYSKYFQEEDSSQEVLNQIKRQCSRKTYNFIRNKLRTSVQSKQQARLQKQIKYNQQLTQKCLKLSQQIAQLKIKLTAAQKPVNEPRKISKVAQSVERGQLYIKWEKSLLYKEKVQSETKKNFNKQFSMLEQEKANNQTIRYAIESLLSKIQQTNGTQVLKNQISQCDKKLLNSLIQETKIILHSQRLVLQSHSEQYCRSQQQIDDIVRELKEGLNK